MFKNPALGFWICLFLGIAVGICAICSCDTRSEYDKAVHYWSQKRNLDESMMRAIVAVESRHGEDLWRNDRNALVRQVWSWQVIREHDLDSYDWKTWSSIGHGQLLYLTAIEMGYEGTPDNLADVQTNMKWCTLYLSDKLKRYKRHNPEWVANLHAIASYNSGRVRWLNGRYRNQKYVDMVVTEWSNERRRR